MLLCAAHHRSCALTITLVTSTASCSAQSKLSAVDAQQRNTEYKQLLRGDSRELKRLRRQVSTYETLARGEWASKTAGLTGSSAASALKETVQVGEEATETLPVDQDTVRRLWRDGRDMSWALAQAQKDSAELSQRLQVSGSSAMLCLRGRTAA